MTSSPSGDNNRVALSVVGSTENAIDVPAAPGRTTVESRTSAEVQPKTPPKAGRARASRVKTRPGKARETPEPGTESSSKSSGEFDLTSPEFYLNRELTWLAFNKRVLNEAADSRTPLLERVKFLAIVSSNLDEFFMKRIGGLKLQVGVGVQDLTIDGRTPLQQIEQCYVIVRELEAESRKLLPRILEGLSEHGIGIDSYQSLGESEQQQLREHFITNIFPLVTP